MNSDVDTRKLRILLLNWQDRRNPGAGGAELHLHRIFGRLAARGHDVTLVASGWPGAPAREDVDGIAVHRVGGRHSYAIRAPRYARRLLAERHFDVVVEDLNKVPLYAPLWASVPVVLIVHHLFGATALRTASLPVAGTTWLLERAIPWVYRGIPTQVVSSSTAVDLAARGLRFEDIVVIHNGVDTSFFTPVGLRPRADVPTFVYLGRLERYKCVHLIIDAVARLRERRVAVRLVVAGKGPDETRLRRRARAAGVADAVEFAGYVDEPRKRALFRDARASVITSPKEGWGLTVLEAAACGTTTIASDSPGLWDAVDHARTGLLVPHGDVMALADAMQRLAREPEYADALARAARRRAEAFEWDRSAALTEMHLSAAAAGRDPAAAVPPVECMPYGRRNRILLARNGCGALPYGSTTYRAEVRAPGVEAHLTIRLGAVEPDGGNPMLHILPEFPGRAAGCFVPLPGWPISTEVLLTRLLRQRYGEDASVTVVVTTATLTPPADGDRR